MDAVTDERLVVRGVDEGVQWQLAIVRDCRRAKSR